MTGAELVLALLQLPTSKIGLEAIIELPEQLADEEWAKVADVRIMPGSTISSEVIVVRAKEQFSY